MRPILAVPLFLSLLTAAATPARAQDALDHLYPNGARRGATVTVALGGAGIPDGAEVIVDGEGISPRGRVAKSAVELAVAPDAAPGRRWLRVVGPKSATPPRPFAVGVIPERLETEPNDRASQAETVTELPVVLNGRVPSRGDLDVYRVKLKAGQCLVVAGEARSLGSPINLLCRIRDSQLRELMIQMDSRTRDTLLGFTAPADGEYFVELQDVMNNYSTVNADYVYRVTLTTGPWMESVYPPGVERGTASEVLVSGWNLAGAQGPSQSAERVNPAADSGADFELRPPGIDQSFRLKVGMYPEVVENERGRESAGTPMPLPVPGTANGRFAVRRDVDEFAIEVSDTRPLLVQVEARSLTSSADPVLEILDESGAVLQRVDDVGAARRGGGRDPRTRWSPPKAGRYRIRLSDLASVSRGGLDFFYRLTVAPPQPVLELTTPQVTIPLKPAMAVQVPVTVLRGEGVGKIRVRMVGLPPEVSCPEVEVAGASGAPASQTVNLTVTAATGSKPGRWPVRIEALAEGGLSDHAAATWVLSKDRSGTLAEGSTEQLLVVLPAP